MPHLTHSAFSAFFEALWDYPPFGWQTRLLERVHTTGWPSILDLPTGSGKTSTLDVALFALALDTFLPVEQRRQSRRIVLVVDRRVVVDQAYKRAATIAKKLDEAKQGILAEVASALRELSGNRNGLPVLPAILRGGMPRETEWAKSPSQPVILTSTVDQVGSRLLFRGYGVSDRMRPVHAGLLGRDTLLLLDEVHLARPFEETLSAIARWYGPGPGELLPRPLNFVRMSATVAEESADTFRLEEADRKNPKLQARLASRKQAILRQVNTPRDPTKAGEAMAKAAMRDLKRLARHSPRAIAVIVNRVDTARQIASLAREGLGDAWAVSLLTGRMRPLDRLERQAAVLDRVAAGRQRTADSPRHLVVSTQAIEAGADFDFDALVTECASLDALRQRFGRLDRLGELRETEAVILAGSGSIDERADDDPIYGAALRATCHWLTTVGEVSDEFDAKVVDFGIDAMAKLLNALNPKAFAALMAPRAVAPVLTSSHLERWVQTSPAPQADPDVAPFLHGIGRGAPEIQIVWRADLGSSMLVTASPSELQARVELVRPSSLEALSVPLWAVRHWLASVRTRQDPSGSDAADTARGLLGDVEGSPVSVDGNADIAPVLVWRGGEVDRIDKADELRPGLTVLVPSSYGGVDSTFDCWDAESTALVRDRGDEAQLLQRGRAAIRWSPDVIAGWGSSLPVALRRGPLLTQENLGDNGPSAERVAFEQWTSKLLECAALPTWARVALKHLQSRSRTVRSTPSASDSGDAPLSGWRISFQSRTVPLRELRSLLDLPELRSPPTIFGTEATTEDDEGSFLGAAVSLAEHLGGVRDFARRFATALHLEETLIEDLALSGWIHDLGKADRRFQLLLHGGDPVREAASRELLAKSHVQEINRPARERARARSGYPRGMRHELMSVALVEGDSGLRKAAHDWELVLHLVASHHGWCRPFAPLVADAEPHSVSVTLAGKTWTASSAHELERFDSTIPQRFWRLVHRYGYWGLAWLEALLRLADHRESERETARERANG